MRITARERAEKKIQGVQAMFGKSKIQDRTAELEARIRELEEELDEKKEVIVEMDQMLNKINSCARLGMWFCYYNEKGEQERVLFTDVMRDMLGYTRNEIPDAIDGLGKIIHPEDAPAVFAAFGAAAADKTNRKKYDIEYRLQTKRDGYKWFHAAGDVVRYPDGSPKIFLGTFSDIDEQKKTAETLEVGRRRQGAVDLMMLEGSWSMDLTKYAIDDPNSPMVFSDQFKKILGYRDSNDFPDIMSSWITKMHPDDVAAASALMGKQLSDPSGKTVFDTEYRMMHKDGEYRWVRASSTVVWSADRRKPLMAAGTILDISEQIKNKLRFQTEMAPNIESLRNGITEIASNVGEAAKQMKDVAQRQADITDSAKKIGTSVDESMKIIDSIQSIANQTNLLSLNASIEAARAGEAGRGFAVVATEVQSLSASTKNTTNDISRILGDMNASVKDMVEKIDRISENVAVENEEMEKINSTIEGLNKFANDIAEMVATLYN